MDCVFKGCDNAAAEERPFWPGQPITAHWGVPDPAKIDGSQIVRRVAFGNLPDAARSYLNLRKPTDWIARSDGAATQPQSHRQDTAKAD